MASRVHNICRLMGLKCRTAVVTLRAQYHRRRLRQQGRLPLHRRSRAWSCYGSGQCRARMLRRGQQHWRRRCLLRVNVGYGMVCRRST